MATVRLCRPVPFACPKALVVPISGIKLVRNGMPGYPCEEHGNGACRPDCLDPFSGVSNGWSIMPVLRG